MERSKFCVMDSGEGVCEGEVEVVVGCGRDWEEDSGARMSAWRVWTLVGIFMMALVCRRQSLPRCCVYSFLFLITQLQVASISGCSCSYSSRPLQPK